jgi:hypothetical protein
VRFQQIVEELHVQFVVFNDQDFFNHWVPLRARPTSGVSRTS